MRLDMRLAARPKAQKAQMEKRKLLPITQIVFTVHEKKIFPHKMLQDRFVPQHPKISGLSPLKVLLLHPKSRATIIDNG